MRSLISFITPILLFSITGCKSPPDKVLEDFKKVNESLEETNKEIDSLYKRSSSALDLEQKTIDSIQLVLRNAHAYLESAKTSLALADTNGENLDAAQTLFINTAKGDSLFYYVMSVCDLGIKYTDKDAERKKFVLQRGINKNRWLEKYFKMVPTIAAKTILSKFQNDCLYIRTMIWGVNAPKMESH